MLAHHSTQSYSGQFTMRRQQQGAAGRAAAADGSPRPTSPLAVATATPYKLLTDRTSYISYLESQLERVSAACLTVASYDERLEAVTSAVRLLEEKVLNVARLVSCTQQFAEQQQQLHRDDLERVGARLAAMESRIEALQRPQAALELRLEEVTKEVEARLKDFTASSAEVLKEVAEGLGRGLEAKVHETQLRLEERVTEAAGRLEEQERKLREVEGYAHQTNVQPQVASLTSRLGSVEDSLGHLARASAGVKGTLAAVEQAVGQLKTAVVALELRPPVEGGCASAEDTLQWLTRAREAIKGEIQSILQQSQQIAEGIQGAQAAARSQPPSPQKEVAAQVLSSMQGTLNTEVHKEVQALQLADSLLGTVAAQVSEQQSPGAVPAQQQQYVSLPVAASATAAATADAAPIAAAASGAQAGAVQAGMIQQGGWSIRAAPAATQPTAPPWLGASVPAAPAQAPPAQQQLAPAWAAMVGGSQGSGAQPGHTLLQLSLPPAAAPLQQRQPQQGTLGSPPCSPSWAQPSACQQWLPSSPGPAGLGCGGPQLTAPPLGAAGAAVSPGAGGLRSSLGQMHGMLQSVGALLEEGNNISGWAENPGQDDPLDSLPVIPSSRRLNRATTTFKSCLKSDLSSSLGRVSTHDPKPAWLPGGPVRTTSTRSTLGGSQGQRAMEERRRRLQQLYAELRQGS